VPALSDGVVSVGLALVPLDAAELDACELGVEGEAPADLDAGPMTPGLVVLVGGGDEVAQGGLAVSVVFALRGALPLEVADAVVLALVVGALVVGVLVVGVLVALVVAVGVLVALALSLGFALSLAGLLLALLARLDTGGAGRTLGDTDLLALAAAEAEEHVVAVPPGWAMALLAWPMPPFEEPCGVPGPVWLCGPLVLGAPIPTCWPIWTMASRVGGNARATPTANTAQAMARAGRSSPSRQSRGSRDASGRRSSCPPWPASCSPRPVFQRRARPARKPPAAADPALECLLA
jgi:hypothetical protein